MDYLLKNRTDIDWITLILVGCVILVALTKILYPLRFQELLKLPITNKYFFVYGRNDGVIHPFNVFLFIVQIVLASLLLLLVYKWRNPSIVSNNSFLYLKICLGLTLFISAKISLEKLIGVIFNISTIIDKYVYQKLSYRNLMSILFMAIVLILVYITPMSSFIFFTIVSIVAILNGIALFSSYKEQRSIILPHFFYFILYLCALEISPYIIIYKVIL